MDRQPRAGELTICGYEDSDEDQVREDVKTFYKGKYDEGDADSKE